MVINKFKSSLKIKTMIKQAEIFIFSGSTDPKKIFKTIGIPDVTIRDSSITPEYLRRVLCPENNKKVPHRFNLGNKETVMVFLGQNLFQMRWKKILILTHDAVRYHVAMHRFLQERGFSVAALSQKTKRNIFLQFSETLSEFAKNLMGEKNSPFHNLEKKFFKLCVSQRKLKETKPSIFQNLVEQN